MFASNVSSLRVAASFQLRMQLNSPNESLKPFWPTAPTDFCLNLKKLELISTCLGQWSRLFECHRPALTELSLSCSHIGLPSVSRFNWSDTASYLWPNLRHLSLRNFHSPKLFKLLKSIVPHLVGFNDLEKLILPTECRIPSLVHGMVSISTMNAVAQLGHPLPVGLCIQTDELVHNISHCPYTEEDQD